MNSPAGDLTIQSHRGPYPVRFGRPFQGLEQGLGPKEHLLIDERVARLYRQPLSAVLNSSSVLQIEATEQNKSLEQFPAYAEHLLSHGLRRDHTLVVVGGGILQDIAAFLAAVLQRGIAWKFYPTTLLAQADSCIGSKSSVNVAGYKNQLGTFTPPQEIWISEELLSSLSETDRRSGIGEMLKVHILAGWEDARGIAADYPFLLQDGDRLRRRIRRSLEIKQRKIEADEFDRGERLLMNYGHSFGHALESATEFRIPHGIAVTIGMDLANYIAWKRGLIEAPVFEELHRLLAPNYAGFEGFEIPEGPFFSALGKDKKNLGAELSLIFLRGGAGGAFRSSTANDEAFRQTCRDFLEGSLCLNR